MALDDAILWTSVIQKGWRWLELRVNFYFSREWRLSSHPWILIITSFWGFFVCFYLFFGVGVPHLLYSEANSSLGSTREGFCSHWLAVCHCAFQINSDTFGLEGTKAVTRLGIPGGILKVAVLSLKEGKAEQHVATALGCPCHLRSCQTALCGAADGRSGGPCHTPPPSAPRRGARSGSSGRAQGWAYGPSRRQIIRQLFRWRYQNHRTGRMIYLCYALASPPCIGVGGWKNTCQKSSTYEFSFLSLGEKCSSLMISSLTTERMSSVPITGAAAPLSRLI